MSVNEEMDEVTRESKFEPFYRQVTSEGVYLSGPIRCVDDNGVGWREQLIEDYPEFEFKNPLDNFSPEECEILNDPIEFDEDADKEQIVPSEYVMEDKMMIMESDAIFIGLPENIARGTMLETMFGYDRGKEFFVWTIDGQAESGWINFHAQFISDNRDEVMEELEQWLKDNT